MQILNITFERMIRRATGIKPQEATAERRIGKRKLGEEALDLAQSHLRTDMVLRKHGVKSGPEKSVQEHIENIFVCNFVWMPSP